MHILLFFNWHSYSVSFVNFIIYNYIFHRHITNHPASRKPTSIFLLHSNGNGTRKNFIISYSHRKKHAEKTEQTAVTPSITQTGSNMLFAPIPRNMFFIIVSPCVNGNTLTTCCIAFGITSIGSVVPESTSIGK